MPSELPTSRAQQCGAHITHAPTPSVCAPQVLPVLLESCTDSHADLRQCAVYGLGVLAAKAGDSFRPYINDALQRISAIIAAPNARCAARRLSGDAAHKKLF